MCCVPSYLKHDSLPCILEVIVDVADVEAVLEAVDVAVLVTVDVLGSVVIVDVAVDETELVTVVVSVV